MGSYQSTVAKCQDKSSIEDIPNATINPDSANPNAMAPTIPRGPTGNIGAMPQFSRPETFEEKLYRKFKAEPLVPIGCLTTAYFLGSGIKSFYNRDAKKSQTMMRLRVGSQFATLMIFVGYAGMNAFTLDLAPGMASPTDQMGGVKKKDDDE